MEEQPTEITVCNLECVVMPNGEVISLGKIIGRFDEFKTHLKSKLKK